MATDDATALLRDHAHIVREEARRFTLRSLDPDDLLQAGAVGLLVAAARFDPSLGPFSAYARLWVRKEMQRAVASAEFSAVVPTELVGRAVALRALADAPDATLDAIADALDLSATTVLGLLRVLALSEPRHDVPAPPSMASAEDEAVLNTLGDALVDAVEALPAEMRAAVVAAYGLGGDDPKSVRAIGRALGISPSTVRARAARAIHHLRRSLRAEASTTRSTTMPTASGRTLEWRDFGFSVRVPSEWEVFPGVNKASNEIVRVKRDAEELSLTLIIWKQPAHGASLAEFAETVRQSLATRGYGTFRVEAATVAGREAMTLQAATVDGWTTRQYYFGGETAVFVLGFGTPSVDSDDEVIVEVADSFALA